MKKYLALGMMSGTSMDGIDAALLETDGLDFVKPLAFAAHGYAVDFRQKLRACLGQKKRESNSELEFVETELTKLHAELVQNLLAQQHVAAENVHLIGFHGQTVWHNPAAGETVQLGSGQLLADLTGISVVNNFRAADVRAGGQGAPLVPLYHKALLQNVQKPVAVLNIGGVSNITYIGAGAEDILAFDTGPGNALLDDWMMEKTGQPYDDSGQVAAAGQVEWGMIKNVLQHPYFELVPPKSLDRNEWQNFMPHGLSVQNGAATLAMLTVQAVKAGLKFLPEMPKTVFVTGGGRLNTTLMNWLRAELALNIEPVEKLGWSGTALEAEAFAYLAVRSLLGLPLSLPGTTGVKSALSGGEHFMPRKLGKCG